MMLVFRLSTAHMLRITIDQAHKELVFLVSIKMFVGMKILLVGAAMDTAESYHVGYLCARANTNVANIFCSNSV